MDLGVEKRGERSGRMVIIVNASKNKGDRGELEAVEVLKQLAPDLVHDRARRKLGAGRRDDTGDLDTFIDVTVQVKCLKDPVDALRKAANGAREQGERAGTRWHMGMAPIPRARKDSVRWVCASYVWPSAPMVQLPAFGTTSRAIAYLRDTNELIETPIERRVALVTHGGGTLIVGTVQAWAESLRTARALVDARG